MFMLLVIKLFLYYTAWIAITPSETKISLYRIWGCDFASIFVTERTCAPLPVVYRIGFCQTRCSSVPWLFTSSFMSARQAIRYKHEHYHSLRLVVLFVLLVVAVLVVLDVRVAPYFDLFHLLHRGVFESVLSD